MNFSRVLPNGRADTRVKWNEHQKIKGPFVPHRLDLIESDAWRSLSRAARMVLDRLEAEHLRNGGVENGNLACTYDDFAAFGIRRPTVSEALTEVIERGLVERIRKGRYSTGDQKWPSLYRLTYLPTTNGAGPTDDWRRWSPPGLRTSQDIDSRNVIVPMEKRRRSAKTGG